MTGLRLAHLLSTAALLVGAASTWAQAGDKVSTWSSLSAAQQQVLAPLQRDWPALNANHRQKWIEVARRFDSMPGDERHRVQERMAEWARMTPAERTQARLQFQEVRQLPPQERTAKWQAYQALPEAERKNLAQRAHPANLPDASSKEAAARRTGATPDLAVARRPAHAASTPLPNRPTAAILVQARPGATTTTMTTHAQARPAAVHGAPKIAATPTYVDPATLLPKRNTEAGPAPAVAADPPPQQ